MPIYEYQCTNCGFEFELRRNFSEADAETVCQKCSHSKVKRKISRFNASSNGKSISGSGSSCSSCSGGNCAGCH